MDEKDTIIVPEEDEYDLHTMTHILQKDDEEGTSPS